MNMYNKKIKGESLKFNRVMPKNPNNKNNSIQ